MTLSNDLDNLSLKLQGWLVNAFEIAKRVADALEPAEQATEAVPDDATQAQMVEAVARHREYTGGYGHAWRNGSFDYAPEYIREQYLLVPSDIKAAVLREVT